MYCLTQSSFLDFDYYNVTYQTASECHQEILIPYEFIKTWSSKHWLIYDFSSHYNNFHCVWIFPFYVCLHRINIWTNFYSASNFNVNKFFSRFSSIECLSFFHSVKAFIHSLPIWCCCGFNRFWFGWFRHVFTFLRFIRLLIQFRHCLLDGSLQMRIQFSAPKNRRIKKFWLLIFDLENCFLFMGKEEGDKATFAHSFHFEYCII